MDYMLFDNVNENIGKISEFLLYTYVYSMFGNNLIETTNFRDDSKLGGKHIHSYEIYRAYILICCLTKFRHICWWQLNHGQNAIM